MTENNGPLAKVISMASTLDAIEAMLEKAACTVNPGNHPLVDSRSPGFHASGMYDICPRQYALAIKLGLPFVRNNLPANILKHAHLGSRIHDLWQNDWLGPAGVLIGKWKCFVCSKFFDYVQRRVEQNIPTGIKPSPKIGTYPPTTHPCSCGNNRWLYQELGVKIKVEGIPATDEWCIVGHFDGITVNDVVIDLKTMYPSGVDRIAESYAVLDTVDDWIYPNDSLHYSHTTPIKHYCQIQVYLAGTEKQDGVILYLPKDKLADPSAAVPVHVTKNDVVIEAMKEKVRVIYKSLNGAELPKRVCATPIAERARSCAVCNQCFAED